MLYGNFLSLESTFTCAHILNTIYVAQSMTSVHRASKLVNKSKIVYGSKYKHKYIFEHYIKIEKRDKIV